MVTITGTVNPQTYAQRALLLKQLWTPAIENCRKGITDCGLMANQELAGKLHEEIWNKIDLAIKKNPQLASPAAFSWIIETKSPGESGELKEGTSAGTHTPGSDRIGCESVGGVLIDLPDGKVKITYPYAISDDTNFYPVAFSQSTVMEISFPDGKKTIALCEKGVYTQLKKIGFVEREGFRAYELSQLDNVLGEYLRIIEKLGNE